MACRNAWKSVVTVGCLATALNLLLWGAALAATVTVTSTGDGVANAANCPSASNCRLRDAIAKAVAGDTITFAASVTPAITLSDGELVIDKALTITGPGAAVLSISGNDVSRIFNITAGNFAVAIQRLTLTRGFAPSTNDGFSTFARGGSIYRDNSGTLSFVDCVLTSNHAVAAATSLSRLAQGGAIYNNRGLLSLTNTTLSDNQAGNASAHYFAQGGAIYSRGGGEVVLDRSALIANNAVAAEGRLDYARPQGGAVFVLDGSLTLTASTASGNTARAADLFQGHAVGGAFYVDNSALQLTDTSVTDNRARVENTATDQRAEGGAIFALNGSIVTILRSTLSGNAVTTLDSERIHGRGGAIFLDDGSLTLTTSTMSGNTAVVSTHAGNTTAEGVGGGIFVGNGLGSATHDLSLTAVTITLNVAGASGADTNTSGGGGVFVTGTATATVRNAIIAGNTTPMATDVSGTFTSGGFNFIGDATGSSGFTHAVNDDQVGPISASPLDPMLGPLGANGGPTETHKPLSGSPVIDKGRAFSLTVDQRNAARTVDNLAITNASDGTDIGAVEADGQPPTTTEITSSQNPALTGTSVTFTATVRDSGSNALVTSGTVTFFDGAAALSPAIPLNALGQASFSTSTLTEGTHNIHADYAGTADFGPSSASMTQVMNNPTVISGNDYCNPGRITIPNGQTSTPYPSNIFVTGFVGNVNSLSVELTNVQSTRALADLDLLLVGPGGQKYVFLSDTGGATSGADLVMADSGASLPTSGAITSGTYKPADTVSDTFASPAPGAPYSSAAPLGTATFASVFNGLSGASVNGTWKLFAESNGGVAPTVTIDSWCLTIAPANIPVTVTTSPAGLSIVVDSVTYTSPQTFSWVPGSTHTIAAVTTQTGTPGQRFVFTAWQDSAVAPASRSVSPVGSTTYTADFKTQFLLITSAGLSGTIAPASSFYDAGNIVVTATSNPGFRFTGFSGALTGTTNPQTLNLSGPSTVIAGFQALNPSMTLTKTSSAPGFAQVGDVLPFTMVATNDGDVPLVNVSITDPLVPALTCTSVGGSPATGQPVSLPPGATLTCTGSYTVTGTDIIAGFVTNTATVSGSYDDGFAISSPLVAHTEALVTVTAQGTVTVLGVAPGVAGTRVAFTTCSVQLQQDWLPVYTKLQFDVWNEDEVKFTGAFECADSWHETDFGAAFDAAQQNFTVGVLGTYGARYRVQAVTSTQCPGARATGLLGVQSMFTGPNARAIGSALAGAGKFTGSIRWDPSGAVPEGRVR